METKTSSGKVGRPKIDIDWDLVNDLLVANCSGAEVAGYIGMSRQHFYQRCADDNGIPFAEYSLQFYSKGDALIRAKQFNKAMDGDNMMLIWLGKNRLKQKDKSDEEINSSKDIIRHLSDAIKQKNGIVTECANECG